MSSARETIRVELSYVASHLRVLRAERPDLFPSEEDQQGRLGRVRSAVDRFSGSGNVEERLSDIETSFDRIAQELDTPSYPTLSEKITNLQSACRTGNHERCLQLASDLVKQFEKELDVDPLYEGTDPFQ